VERGKLFELGSWIVCDILALEPLGRKDKWTLKERGEIQGLLQNLNEYTEKMLAWGENRGITIK
jgi:hypothetical protein